MVQRYRCLPCSHDYSSLEAASLLDLARGALCCAICGEELSQARRRLLLYGSLHGYTYRLAGAELA